jgi:hypothetical protein
MREAEQERGEKESEQQLRRDAQGHWILQKLGIFRIALHFA